MTDREPEGGERRRLQDPSPLSQSMLWRLHDDYFRRSGVAAWSSGDVPHVLTNSPMIARAYAQILEGVLADCAAGRFGASEPGEPLYVVELGAGTGGLGFNVLHALAGGGGGAPGIVYVLTDAFDSNLAFWRRHPRLQPFFDAGRLDLARFDAVEGGPLHLERSGRVLTPGSLANPLVVVANYLFDVLRQDLYLAGDGLLEELIGVLAPEGGQEIGSREFFRQLLIEVSRVPVPPDRYPDPAIQSVLEEERNERGAGGQSRFLFPAGAIGGLEQLAALADGRMVLIVGERPGEPGQPEATDPPAGAGAAVNAVGDRVPEDPAVPGGNGACPLPPGTYRPAHLLAMGVHGGSISLPVDLDLLTRLLQRRGGELLLPDALPAGLLVGCCVVGDGGAATATRRAFKLAIDEGGPEDLFLSLRAMLDRGVDELALAMVLAFLRVGGYDAHLFRQVHDRLAGLLPKADAGGKAEAARVMREVWERYYPIDERTDLAFGIAALLGPAGYVEEALEFLGYSHDHQPTPLGCYNTALCHLLLGNEGAAREAVAEALRLDPDLEQALELVRKMDEVEAARGG